MNDDLDVSLPQGEPVDAAVLKRLGAQMAATASPSVRPLPSNTVLLTISLALFLLISFALGSVVKFKAFSALSGGEMSIYYGVISLFAIFFARAVVERMIPGEKRIMPSVALW